MAIASLVLGIVGIVFAFIFPFVSPVAAIVGLILAVIARKKLKEAEQPAGAATAGMVLSIISLAFGIVMIACVACIGAAVLAELGI